MSTLRERIAEQVSLAWETYTTPDELTDAIMREVEADRAALQKRLDDLLSDAVPDKKWEKVFKGTAADYLRHRAVHFIQNYGEPERGARLNQLANEVEQAEADRAKLVEAAEAVLADHDERVALPHHPDRDQPHKILVMETLRAALASMKEKKWQA